MTMAHDPRAGMAVYTMDNERLGEVKEVRGAYFKVDASMEPDYWLGMDAVADCADATVRLSFNKDVVGEHKVDESRIAP